MKRTAAGGGAGTRKRVPGDLQVARSLHWQTPPATAADRAEIVAGLRSSPRRLPTRYFYDPLGAELFEAITATRAYYPTRVETAILRAHAAELASNVGAHARIIEFGSGSGVKTQILLDAVEKPATYIPIDVSCQQLEQFAAGLRQQYPTLHVLPVCADYLKPLSLPAPQASDGRVVVFFPGSTIGNFEPAEALSFLRRCAELCRDDGFAIVGIDLKKDRRTLERAYNDPEGVTAAFNLNILTHINRAFQTDFDLSAFRHYAYYNEAASRIEMQLISLRSQTVCIPLQDGDFVQVSLAPGEPIVTEHSYKFEIPEFERLARCAGLQPGPVWMDAKQRFAECLLMVGTGR
jgi:L-histidine Nalpha-methyltransferase